MTHRSRGVVLVLIAAVSAAISACSAVGATPRPPAERQPEQPNVMGATPAASTADVSERASGGGDAVAHHSARLEDVEPIDKPRPTRLRIDAIGVDAPVVALGVAGNGEMDVPTDAGTVAWYEHGPSPGQEGSAVLAAHVDYNGRRGVFFDLSDLPEGATLTVMFDGAPSRTFTVVKGGSIAKTALPVDELFRRDGRAELTLITCGGEFDAATRSYRNNVVVRTVPTSD
jgi:sortase (surface protein transpeptidase)